VLTTSATGRPDFLDRREKPAFRSATQSAEAEEGAARPTLPDTIIADAIGKLAGDQVTPV
jgi:hypothetical protein